MDENKTEQEVVDQVVRKWIDRRLFAKVVSVAGAGLLAGGGRTAQAQAVSDTDILNFALNLEYMEAEFYTLITSGRTIDQSPFNIPITGVGTPGPTTGAAQLDLSADPILNFTLLELAYNERAHVQLLRSALGTAAIAKPALNFTPAAAATVNRFLQVARVFEDVGLSSYAGAAPLINSRTILATSARITGEEGIHIGSIRTHIAQRGLTDIGPVDPLDIVVQVPPRLGARIFTADAQGLPPVRTFSQVLSIVYGPGAPPGTDRGLLFPNGFNGNIRTV